MGKKFTDQKEPPSVFQEKKSGDPLYAGFNATKIAPGSRERKDRVLVIKPPM